MATEFDNEIISELKELMEDDFVVLLEAFVGDSKLKLVELQQAVKAMNAEEIRKTAHSLKGSSANLGAARLSGACMDLELMGRNNTLEGVDNKLEEVIAAHAAAVIHFSSMIEAQSH